MLHLSDHATDTPTAPSADTGALAPSDRRPSPTPAAAAAPSRRRWDGQTVALAAGGVAFAVGNLLHPLEHREEAYHAATWGAAHLVIFAAIPLLVLGLPALQRALAARVGPRLATLPVIGVIAGLIAIAPGTIIEAFVAPAIGHEAMHELESGGMGVVNAIFGLAFIGGTLALGWAAHRARLRPRWAGPAVMAAAVVLVAVMSATGPAAGAAIIAATAVYGLALTALAVRG